MHNDNDHPAGNIFNSWDLSAQTHPSALELYPSSKKPAAESSSDRWCVILRVVRNPYGSRGGQVGAHTGRAGDRKKGHRSILCCSE